MSKIKIKIYKSQIVAKSKLSKSEQINDREITVFSNTLLKGFMRPVPEDVKTINYIGPQGHSLSQLLKDGIDSNTYFLIIAQILEAIKRVRENCLNPHNLLLDIHYIFINITTKELSFIYQPIVNVSAHTHAAVDDYGQAVEFVHKFIFKPVFKAGEDLQEVSSFIHALKEVNPFSLAEIEKTLRCVYPSAYAQTEGLDPGGYMMSHDNTAKPCLDEQTETLSETEEQPAHRISTLYPYLIRKKNKEKILINKPVFRLGKEKSYVDYFIFDNNAVSRSHADFIAKEDRYFILDLNSTNKTYVNGKAADPHTEVELADNTIIRLGDEEFTFHIR